ncbi:MAG TPA: hypothetical protein PK059_02045 [Cyclobacteriaceae bacterium]|nr:hypothetical protein [Cyclobacteriaceae bacterium]
MIARNILITDAATEPLKDQEAVDHLREDINNMGKIRPYLVGARQSIEQELISVKLTQQTYELQMDGWYTDGFGFPVTASSYPTYYGYVTLPACPLVSITSIKYDDVNNVEQTLASSNYAVDTSSMPGRFRFTGSATLPNLYDKPNCVRIRYVAGFGASGATDAGQSAVPEPLKNAVRFRMQVLSERGEGSKVLEPIIQNLISPYRIPV